jgi:outer membrane protein OmpA-like peptidoglycan-associated protein
MRRFAVIAFLMLCAAAVVPVYGQYKDVGFEVGVHGGIAHDLSTGTTDVIPGGMLGLDIAFPLFPALQLEASGSYAELHSAHTRTVFIPGDLKLKLAPFRISGFIPYLFAGAGVSYYTHEKQPDTITVSSQDLAETGFVLYVPAGVGFQFKVSDHTSLDLRGSYDYVASPDLTPDPDQDNDAFATALIGLRVNGGPRNQDTDGDLLLNKDEKKVGTDPKNPDTDADSLTDYDEHVTHKTNPLKADTDDDGLMDGNEVLVQKTDPLNPDTDGDGLTDGHEVMDLGTNPLKVDTDGDGLADGAELTQYKTDPLKADTDGDGLSDGAEVNQHKTDPKKQDTDGGTIADGLEVERKSNPLDPSDDMPATPPPQVIIFELNKPVVLEGINFAFNSAEILPESEKILNPALESLKAHQEIVVEISGHTDSKGSDEYNQSLSERRANAVRNWMMNHGITGSRMAAIGYGEKRPIASNDSEDGRLRNRRIEFTRTK